jgi:hypothetical protein
MLPFSSFCPLPIPFTHLQPPTSLDRTSWTLILFLFPNVFINKRKSSSFLIRPSSSSAAFPSDAVLFTTFPIRLRLPQLGPPTLQPSTSSAFSFSRKLRMRRQREADASQQSCYGFFRALSRNHRLGLRTDTKMTTLAPYDIATKLD